jgi:hypothetical protein
MLVVVSALVSKPQGVHARSLNSLFVPSYSGVMGGAMNEFPEIKKSNLMPGPDSRNLPFCD